MAAATLHAQPTQQGTPRARAADLLVVGRRDLDNLAYSRVITTARKALDPELGATPEERVKALELLAAAMYPDDDEAPHHADSAMTAFARILRNRPDHRLSPDISWRGLDSLFEVARHTTLGAAATMDPEYVLRDFGGLVSLRALSTRPARFLLIAYPRGGAAPVPLDSAGPSTDARLEFAVSVNGVPVLATGRYAMRIIVVDQERPDTMTLVFPVSVEATGFQAVPTPLPPADSLFRPEVVLPHRTRGIVFGLVAGAAAAGLAYGVRPAEPARSATPPDARASIVAGGIVALSITGALLDRARPIPQNVAQNATLRQLHAQAVASAEAETARRRAAFRVRVVREMGETP